MSSNREIARSSLIDYVHFWVYSNFPKLKIVKYGIKKEDGNEFIALIPAGGSDRRFPEQIDQRIQIISSSSTQEKAYKNLLDVLNMLGENYSITLNPPTGKVTGLKIQQIILDSLPLPLGYESGAYKYSSNYIFRVR
ncbi:MAG: hypothetical protein L6Q54_11675 [Leptospiraceae bacterium]|nr:hypothetical protein [Leptospiraceae bacterium]